MKADSLSYPSIFLIPKLTHNSHNAHSRQQNTLQCKSYLIFHSSGLWFYHKGYTISKIGKKAVEMFRKIHFEISPLNCFTLTGAFSCAELVFIRGRVAAKEDRLQSFLLPCSRGVIQKLVKVQTFSQQGRGVNCANPK